MLIDNPFSEVPSPMHTNKVSKVFRRETGPHHHSSSTIPNNSHQDFSTNSCSASYQIHQHCRLVKSWTLPKQSTQFQFKSLDSLCCEGRISLPNNHLACNQGLMVFIEAERARRFYQGWKQMCLCCCRKKIQLMLVFKSVMQLFFKKCLAAVVYY